jgi:transcriptional antiterminator NusG
MNWFVLRVASNKEGSVRETLLRKVQIENMTHLVGRILVPTEKIKTIKEQQPRSPRTSSIPGTCSSRCGWSRTGGSRRMCSS